MRSCDIVAQYTMTKCERSLNMTKKATSIILVVAVILMVLAYTQLTIFVIAPIGAIPEGKTVIISRLNKTEFIDSADAMCERMQGGVSLLCRAMTMGAVFEKRSVLLLLPY